MSSRRAVGLDLHSVRGDFASQRLGVRKGPWPGAGKSDIDGVDSQGLHQMQDFDLFFDAGVEDRGILQTVAKGFVIHQHACARRNRRRRGHVPVVDPFVLLHSRPRLLRKR
jgi:hypothetical protein